MKKKVLYGVSMAFLACAAMGPLQSCKDDLSDLRHQVNYDQKDLTGKLTALQAELDGVRIHHKASIDSLAKVLKDVGEELDRVGNEQDQDSLLIKGLRTDLDKLTSGMGDLSIIDQIKATVAELLANGTIPSGGNYDDAIRGLNDSIIAINARIDLIPDLSSRVEKLETYSAALDTIIPGYSKLSETVGTIAAQYQAQQKALDDVKNELEELNKNIYGVGGLSEQMSMYYKELTDKIEDRYNELAANNKELWESIYAPGGLSDQMSQYYQDNKAAIEDLSKDQQELWESIYAPGGLSDQMSQYYQDNKAAIEANAASTQELWESVFGEGGLTTLISQYYNANKAEIDELRESNTELWESIYGEGGLTTQISQYYNANKNAIEELADDMQKQLGKILERIDNIITGILIQGTDCPVFGNFSLPLGIKSNLLFNWYGYNDLPEFQFPTGNGMYNYYDLEGAAPVLTQTELDALSPQKYEKVAEGLLGDVNVGRLYMTINPAGHYFNNEAFSLETSAGKKFPADLQVSKSKHELYFGYTRGIVQGNGFYQADVIIPEDQILNAKLTIDEDLKAAAKDALKDPSKRTAYELLKAVYSQLNGKFPAYGVRYNWSNYSVLSGYDVAATTAKPLSYAFLYDQGTNKHLPTFGHLNNIFENLIDKDKLNITIPQNFHVDGFTFDFTGMDITLSASPDIEYNETITVTIPGFTAYGQDAYGNEVIVDIPDQHADLTPDQLSGLLDAIKGGFESAIDDMNDQLKGQLNDQIRTQIVDKLTGQVNDMLKNIEKSVNDMLADLEKEINGQISDMLDDILGSIEDKTGTLFNRVNDAIDLYNKVARKINHVLKNPNHYLQVAMFYKGNGTGTVGILSNDKMHPTKFVSAGGNAISLYASSYSAEILAPAYLKYIAVSNVYNLNGTVNDAEKANIASINEASGLNKVFPGSTKRVGIAANKLKKDLVYEIVYQGVDYSGRTSTQKFYITVNK